MTTQDDIKRWLERGIAEKQTHVVVVCDTYDHEDYPVYIGPSENVREIAAKYQGQNMQRIMEVYNLALPIEDQLKQTRVFNY